MYFVIHTNLISNDTTRQQGSDFWAYIVMRWARRNTNESISISASYVVPIWDVCSGMVSICLKLVRALKGRNPPAFVCAWWTFISSILFGYTVISSDFLYCYRTLFFNSDRHQLSFAQSARERWLSWRPSLRLLIPFQALSMPGFADTTI